MKKLIIFPLIFSALILNAQQWGGSTTTTNLIYRPGQVLVGGTSPTGSFQSQQGVIEIQSPLNDFGFLAFRNATDNTNIMDIYFKNSYAGTIGTRGVPFLLAMNGTERFRLSTNGNIGIGTTTPTTKLEVNSSVANTSGLKFTQLTSSSTTAANNGKALSVDATGNVILTTGTADWSLTGNAGTVDGTNFIGTTDNVPFNIRVNNIGAGRIDATLANSFYGSSAGIINTTGNQNVAIGYSALFTNGTGYLNTAIGALSLFRNTSGGTNTAVGNSALQGNTTGNYNSACGIYALNNNETGSNNTALGYSANPTALALSNSTALGANALVNASNKVRIGNVNVTVIEGQPAAYTGISDGRFKTNINEEEIKGLEFIKRLRCVAYNFETKNFKSF